MISHTFTFPPLTNSTPGQPNKLPPLASRLVGERDPFLEALLALPSAQQRRRNPIDWAASLLVHLVVIASIIAIPLYYTDSIDLRAFAITALVAAPPPPPPPPPPGGGIAKQAMKPKVAQFLHQGALTAPTFIPRQIAIIHDASNADPNDGVLGGVPGGIPGGVPGGVLGGVLGGVIGGAVGSAGPPPPPAKLLAHRILRVGGEVKPPKLLLHPEPLYPQLAKATRVEGTVIIDAMIDEKGNVVEAHVVSGPGLLIQAALQAITSWKYEPTYLDGEPISVRMHVDVNFFLH